MIRGRISPPLIPRSTAIPPERAPLKLPDQVRHHSEKSTDSLRHGPPRKKWKIGGNKRASRAHNLPPIPARMSA